MPDGPAGLAVTVSKRAFILAQTKLLPVVGVNDILLHQAADIHQLWQLLEHNSGYKDMPPPFWAFAWAGGCGVARYIIDHPQLVAHKHVCDFASGSGIVAIAAKKAGAKQVTSYDVDPFASIVTELNSFANRVTVEAVTQNIVGSNYGFDVILVGDIFYDRTLCNIAMPWLQQCAARGILVIVGDPDRRYCPQQGVGLMARYTLPVSAMLEGVDDKSVAIWQVTAGGSSAYFN